MFYPDKKEYISPSAMNTWFNNRGSFISSYFEGIRSEDTPYMKAGRMIHGLIEGGMFEGHKQFTKNEKELVHPSPVAGVNVLGKPDSFGFEGDKAYFVDYKTGKDVAFTREELALDIKMRLTAWLVWKELKKPTEVTGYIVWIGTEWDGEELIASDDEYMIIKYVYTAKELEDFEKVITKAIEDINKTYEVYLNSSDTVDEGLCREYAELDKQIKDIELTQISPLKERQDELKKQIADQMEFGSTENHKSEFGTFFWKRNATYEYPSNVEFQIESGNTFTFALGEEIVTALKVAKKNYEQYSTPVKESKFIQFRGKK